MDDIRKEDERNSAEITSAFSQGFSAHKNGEPLVRNPFSIADTKKWFAWNDGWNAANPKKEVGP